MKPFKTKTKTGDRWYVMDGNSLVEVAAADVPVVTARMEAEDRAAELASSKRSAAVRSEEVRAASEGPVLAMLGVSTDPSYPNWTRFDT